MARGRPISKEDSPNGSTLDGRDVARKYGGKHRRRQRGSTLGICQTVSDDVKEKYAILCLDSVDGDQEQCTFSIHRILEVTGMARAETNIEAVLVF